MKKRKKLNSFLALLLTLALLLGMLPTAALAAGPGEKPDEIEFKAMLLYNLAGGRVAECQYANTSNKFYNKVNMNDGITWTMLTYTIEKSQPVSLMLYRMADEYQTDAKEESLNHSESAIPDEPFLGEFVGYLYGSPIDDNGEPFKNNIPDNIRNELIWAAVRGELPQQAIKEFPAYGATGAELAKFSLPEPTPTPTPEVTPPPRRK